MTGGAVDSAGGGGSNSAVLAAIAAINRAAIGIKVLHDRCGTPAARVVTLSFACVVVAGTINDLLAKTTDMHVHPTEIGKTASYFVFSWALA